MSLASSHEQCEELFRLARSGSGEALGQLLTLFRPYLLGMANDELDSDLRAKAGASDLVQDTFLNAHQHFDDFRGSGLDEMLAWLRQILGNRTANFRRHYLQTDKRRSQREIPLEMVPPLEAVNFSRDLPPEMLLIRTEQFQSLEAALELLPVPVRELIVWRNLERMPFREIAERLDVTEKTAQKRWAAAILSLRDRLHELDR